MDSLQIENEMQSHTIKVRVPGTSANCGPGFDCIGLACTIYNDLQLTLLKEPMLVIETKGEGAVMIVPSFRTRKKLLCPASVISPLGQ